MRQALANCGWILALLAPSLLSTELGVQAQQQSTSCDSQTWEITADGPSSPGEITAALIEAAACNGTNVVSVKWIGSMETNAPFSVQAGVELRIEGEGTVFDEALLDSPYSSAAHSAGAATAIDAGSGSDLASSASDSSSGSGSSNNSSRGSGSAEPSVISSNGTTSLFVVEVGGALHLSNMTLTGAWGGEQGGGGCLLYTSPSPRD